mmetsp:Transcript_60336/g.123991  ORF Transcript_60336/g.123991 Transcript_60336/m.123991 type:complete len:133 (-) Transcript_60336:294-692(-)
MKDTNPASLWDEEPHNQYPDESSGLANLQPQAKDMFRSATYLRDAWKGLRGRIMQMNNPYEKSGQNDDGTWKPMIQFLHFSGAKSLVNGAVQYGKTDWAIYYVWLMCRKHPHVLSNIKATLDHQQKTAQLQY